MGVGGVGVVVFEAEDGIRDLVRSRGLGDVYKRQAQPAAGSDGGPGHTQHFAREGGAVFSQDRVFLL